MIPLVLKIFQPHYAFDSDFAYTRRTRLDHTWDTNSLTSKYLCNKLTLIRVTGIFSSLFSVNWYMSLQTSLGSGRKLLHKHSATRTKKDCPVSWRQWFYKWYCVSALLLGFAPTPETWVCKTISTDPRTLLKVGNKQCVHAKKKKTT